MKNVIVPDKLIINSNQNIRELPYFSMGEVINKKIFIPNKEKYNIDFNIVEDPYFYFDKKFNQFFSHYSVGDNSIYYERIYSKIKCQITIKNLLDDNFKVYVNKNYLRFVRLKMDNLYPVGTHLKDLTLTKIIIDGDLIIHAASLHNQKTKDSFLCIAPPDTGKTYTTSMLLKEQDKYKFLGEDLSYYDNKNNQLLCVPLTSTWGSKYNFSGLDLINKVPFLGPFSTGKRKVVTDIFGSNAIIRNSKLSRIYLLEKSIENDLSETDCNGNIVGKIMTIHRNEFSYFKNPLLRAFEYFNKDKMDIDDIFNKEKESFIKLLNSKKLYKVQATSYKNFYKMIDQNENSIK